MSTTVKKVTDPVEFRRDQFLDRLMGALAGTFDIFTIYIGDRLGFYEALPDRNQ